MLKTRWSRWEGTYKLFTKHCDGCKGYLQIKNFEVCGWGTAFKYLSRDGKLKGCSLINKTSINKETMIYLEGLIKEDEKKEPIQLKLEFNQNAMD